MANGSLLGNIGRGVLSFGTGLTGSQIDAQRATADLARQQLVQQQLAAQQQQQRNAQLQGLQGQILQGQQPVAPGLGVQGPTQPVAQQVAQGAAAQQELETFFPEQAEAVQKARKARFEASSEAEKTRINSVVKGALDVQGLPPAQQISRLTARRNALAANGIDTTDTDEVISLLQAGNVEQANQLIDQSVQAGRGLGILEDTATEQAKLDIQRQNTELRALEREQRILDREVSRETNRLRQQELQQQLDEKNRQVNQKKLERQFEADSAIGNVDNSIATVDRLLTGEGLESAAGVSAAFPTIPGTEAANFEAELETLQSQAFLAQVEKMKGLGALSENEGKKLGAAIGALSLTQSDESLRASLERIKEQFETAKRKLSAKFGRQQAAPISLEGLTPEDLQSLSDEELQRLAQGAQ